MSLIFKDKEFVNLYNDAQLEKQKSKREIQIKNKVEFLNDCTCCVVCGKSPEIDEKDIVITLIKHHVSYFPEKIAYVHNECHKKIHKTPNSVLIQYELGDSKKYYDLQKDKELFN